ncbi:MAG: ABC transporter ATP-binding protein [Promethearchaeota archaeon]
MEHRAPILKINSFFFKYEPKNDWLLEDINLSFFPGENVLVTGKSGCGKSSLAYCITGIVPDIIEGNWKGDIIIDDGEKMFSPLKTMLPECSKYVSYVSQNPDEQLVHFDVLGELVFGPENLRLPEKEIWSRINFISKELDFEHLLNKEVDQLSGGEKQLVAIASQLIMGSKILILDEPSAFLDPPNFRILVNTLKRIMVRKNSSQDAPASLPNDILTIIIDHKVDWILPHVDRVISIGDKGRVDFDNSKEKFLDGHAENIDGKQSVISSWFLNLLRETRAKGNARQFLKVFYESKKGLVNNAPELTNKQMNELLASDMISQELKKHDTSISKGNVRNPNTNVILKIKNLSFQYPRADGLALDNLQLEIQEGEFVGIMGKNGSGKTTLLWALSRLLAPSKNSEIFFKGKNILEMDFEDYIKHVGFIFQNPEVQIFCPTIKKELLYTVKNFRVESPSSDQIKSMMQVIGISNKKSIENPFLLSWGQKRRLNIMSALVHDPDIIMLDEPFIGHDLESRKKMIKILLEMKKKGKTILLVSHDADMIYHLCDRVLFLENGKIIGDGHPLQVIPKDFWTMKMTLLHSAIKLKHEVIYA